MASAEELLEHPWVVQHKELDVKEWILENC